MPKLSVVMCVYNEKKDWLKIASESILNQSFSDFEFLIVIDNPDLNKESFNYLKELELEDKRVKLLFNESNMGLARSLNKAIEYSNCEFIARMDADDISLPNRFEIEMNSLLNSNADVISCLRINIDQNGNEIDRSNLTMRPPEITLRASNCICHPGVIMRRDSFFEVGMYRPFPKSQDYDLWLRMLSAKKRIQIENHYLIKYRIRNNSISTSNILEQFYISEYQKKLYKQRQIYGIDSFSIEDLNEYLRKKNVTERKTLHYKKARNLANKSLDSLRNHNYLCAVLFLIQSFMFFPKVSYNSVKAFLLFRGR